MEHFANQPFIVALDDDPTVPLLLGRATGIMAKGFEAPNDLSIFKSAASPLAAFIDIHFGTEESGLDIIPSLRARWPYCPIIVVTSDSAEEALVQAFNKGADDFLQKPIKVKEVQARFKARLLGLQERAAKTQLAVGDLKLDTAHRMISGPLGTQFLAPVETLMLAHLIKACGTLAPKPVLKREAWGEVKVSDNAFYRKLFELRRAVEGVTRNVKIQSIYGAGLSLEVSA